MPLHNHKKDSNLAKASQTVKQSTAELASCQATPASCQPSALFQRQENNKNDNSNKRIFLFFHVFTSLEVALRFPSTELYLYTWLIYPELSHFWQISSLIFYHYFFYRFNTSPGENRTQI